MASGISVVVEHDSVPRKKQPTSCCPRPLPCLQSLRRSFRCAYWFVRCCQSWRIWSIDGLLCGWRCLQGVQHRGLDCGVVCGH